MKQTIEQLLWRQEQLEDNCLSKGAARFRERLETAKSKGRETTIGAARKLLVEAINPVEKGIQAMLDEAKTPGRRGRRHFAVKWCEAVGADVAAYITVKVVLDVMASRAPVRKVASSICALLIDELRYRRFQEQAPGLFKYRMGKFQTSNYAHMARSLDAAINYAKVDMSDLVMLPSVKMLVGTKLLDILIETTGLCAIEQRFSKQTRSVRRKEVRRELLLVPAKDTAEWMQLRNLALEFLWPVNLPMIVPPLPWAPGQRGGYRFAMRDKHDLVRSPSRITQEKVRATPMPIVYAAVNRIQETAWRINPHVLSLVQQLVERGGGVANLPSTEPFRLPLKPADIATNEIARRQWRREASKVKADEHERQVKAKEFSNTLTTALAVHREDAIFFPCNVDFRGRVYPIVNYLSPQGDDLSKALLTFAQGKPLGTDGADWLATHGANCLGETPDGLKLSKATLQERCNWIVTHTLDIEAIAADPFSNTWWHTADDPFQFYAFCVEWAGYVAAARKGEGEEYVCSLPCAMDGTCNGLQHFAAMLRDQSGGEAVNLVPQDRPQDIYQRIADDVLRQLEYLAVDDELARLWLTSGLVNRKLCKRPTMTFGYGSKKFGFREQLLKYLQEQPDWKTIDRHFTSSDTPMAPRACSLMALLIDNALKLHVDGACRGMEWLQKVARHVAQQGLCLEWQVPGTNFPVRQEYMTVTKRQIKTMLAGKVIQPALYEATPEPNANKQSNAIAPNFVHSLDAAALMMTVELAASEGVESFAMVHDSYGTLPADCATLAQCTREAFFKLYTRYDVLESFRAQMACVWADVPAPPTKGTLDPSGVLVSDYFFC